MSNRYKCAFFSLLFDCSRFLFELLFIFTFIGLPSKAVNGRPSITIVLLSWAFVLIYKSHNFLQPLTEPVQWAKDIIAVSTQEHNI